MLYDWIMGLLGGLLIGLAASIYLLGLGRVMGASGILQGALKMPNQPRVQQNIAFLIGVLTLPVIGQFFTGPSDTHITHTPVLLIVGGLAVGVGVAMANGGTSGHGVCGMSRFTVRSIIATFIYLGAGFVTMLVGRHIWGII